ncbi:MAG: RNA-binding protein, partial [Proteobacteria bacterium]|nr:RNA-binding protein [Pseudomonadota bacterium]
HDLFSSAGTVESAKIVMDRDTGRSKGFGFVEMATDADANERTIPHAPPIPARFRCPSDPGSLAGSPPARGPWPPDALCHHRWSGQGGGWG